MRISFMFIFSAVISFTGLLMLFINLDHFQQLIATDETVVWLIAALGGLVMVQYELRQLENERLRKAIGRYKTKIKAMGRLYGIPITPLDLEGFLSEREIAAIWEEIVGEEDNHSCEYGGGEGDDHPAD